MKRRTCGDIMAYDAEYLAASAGRNRPKVILTFRPCPARTFACLNIGLSRAQAKRLLEDLRYVFANYPSLQEPDAPEEPAPEPEVKPEAPRCPQRHGRKRGPE